MDEPNVDMISSEAASAEVAAEATVEDIINEEAATPDAASTKHRKKSAPTPEAVENAEEKVDFFAEVLAEDDCAENEDAAIDPEEILSNVEAGDEAPAMEEIVPSRRSAKAATGSKILRETYAEREKRNVIAGLTKTAANNKQIVRGTAVSIETEGSENGLVVWSDPPYQMHVFIPFSEVYITDPIADRTISEEERSVREHQIMRKMLGAKLAFIVRSVSASEKESNRSRGSRKAALTILRDAYFTKGALHQVKEGATLTGDIIGVSYNAIRVCFHGVDVTITKRDLANSYIENVAECGDYAVGTTIAAKVSKLRFLDNGKIDTENSIFSVRAHKSEIEAANRKEIKENAEYIAQVVSVFADRAKHTTNYKLYIPAFNVTAFATSAYLSKDNMRRLPTQGNRVLFKVKNVSDRIIAGVIMRVIV